MAAEKERECREYLRSLLEVRTVESADAVKFTLFVPPKRASIGKLIATTRFVEHAAGRVETALIENVAVSLKFRGNGFGEYLLELCKVYFKQRHISHFALEAEEDMARYGKLVRFYEVNGFQVSRPEAKPKLLYNGDQTLRVVNMEQVLQEPHEEPSGMPSTSSLPRFMSLRFAETMLQETLTHTRSRLTMKDALLLAEKLRPGVIARGVWLAMALEDGEHPEWLQAVGLIYGVGVIQGSFAWEAPITDTRLAFVKRVKLPSWALSDKDGPWNNKVYLRAVLTARQDNRAKILLPPEGLSVFEEDPAGQSVWKQLLEQYAVDFGQTCSGDLSPIHLRMLDMYFPEPLCW